MEYLPTLLDDCKDLSDVFEVVKKAVEDSLGLRRAGLMLGLADLPLQLTAFHVVASNIIVMNENSYNRVLEKTPDMINTWSFRVLLHEYLHSLGYHKESEVRRLVHEISGSLLEKARLDAQIPEYRLHYFSPRGRYINRERRRLSSLEIKLVKGFDRSSSRYIT